MEVAWDKDLTSSPAWGDPSEYGSQVANLFPASCWAASSFPGSGLFREENKSPDVVKDPCDKNTQTSKAFHWNLFEFCFENKIVSKKGIGFYTYNVLKFPMILPLAQR